MSLTVNSELESRPLAPTLRLPIDNLRAAKGVRSCGLDQRHVERLMEAVGRWPPIVVWGKDHVVLDGAHRVEAARQLKIATVAAVRFTGTREEAFVESVRRNVSHGLPLSVADRRRAALRVLGRHAEWSDRRIASVCGLSGKTVARLRRGEVAACSTDDGVLDGPPRRVGRDGSIRPIRPGEVRDRIRQALEDDPGASLRTIAASVGASPETVRSVRAGLNGAGRQERGSTALTVTALRPLSAETTRPLKRIAVTQPPADQVSNSVTRQGERWTSDPALLVCGDGGDFARWFAATNIGEEWHACVWAVPLGRIYEVVDEARRRAAMWSSFASLLESRTR